MKRKKTLDFARDFKTSFNTRLLDTGELVNLMNAIAPYVDEIQRSKVACDERFTSLAGVLLTEFERYRETLSPQNQVSTWWPEIRRQAYDTLIWLRYSETQKGRETPLTSWYDAALSDQEFPYNIQEELLLRYFKQAYKEKYVILYD